jgi:hypothetical protein
MRLLLEIDYRKILFGKGAKVNELIEAFDDAKMVHVEGGYSEPKRFIIEKDAEMNLTLINDNDIGLPENQEKIEVKETFEMFYDLRDKNKKLEEENTELKKQIEEITKVIQLPTGS